MSGAAAPVDVFRQAFEARAGGRAPAWLGALREQAFSRYAAKGLPTTRDEEWKYTSVQPIAQTAFSEPTGYEASTSDLVQAGFVDLGGPLAVFVNGRLHVGRSRLPHDGLRVSGLREAVESAPARLEGRLGREAADRTPFAALNTALAEDGAVVEVAAGSVTAEPLQLVFYSSAAAARPSSTHPRVLVLAGRGSEATVVETHVGRGVYLTNAVTELLLEDGARLDHVKLQRESEAAFHVALVAAALGRDARLVQHHVSLGARLGRADIEARFEGEGAECAMYGLFHADGERLTDTHTRLDHAVPRATSQELYKGILDGRARGVFHGRIVVRKDAQKTSAYQTNKNLLLSRHALVQSTPQLEILADDVKCKHGATTGQLEEGALFYLRSRGLGEGAARSLLTHAFASDVTHRLPHPALRDAVAAHLHVRLGGGREIEEAAL
ncbi:MAG TPA: Fe-S cluster assembly protein SufD [Vicinamibacteria bacterium]|nr:Fe-S cluster assembly protein SufD [Vicinamibacteria bacterium]